MEWVNNNLHFIGGEADVKRLLGLKRKRLHCNIRWMALKDCYKKT